MSAFSVWIKLPNSLTGNRLLPTAFLAFISSLVKAFFFAKGKMQQHAKLVKHLLLFQAGWKQIPLGYLLLRAMGNKSLLQLKQSSNFREHKSDLGAWRGEHSCPWKHKPPAFPLASYKLGKKQRKK